MNERKITDLTLEEIDEEINSMTNFGLDGDGYGDPDAWKAHDRKLQVLMSLRAQKLAENQPKAAKIDYLFPPVSSPTIASTLRTHLSKITNSDTKVFVEEGIQCFERHFIAPPLYLLGLVQYHCYKLTLSIVL